MGGDRKPWTPRPEGQDRPAWKDRTPTRTWTPRGEDRPSFADRKPSFDRKPFFGARPDRMGGDRAWTPRPKADGDRPRAKTSWGGVKEWYTQHLQGNDTYHRQVVLPNLLRCIAPKAGEKALDVACGEGFFSRALAESGCDVVGADVSTELVTEARKVAPASGATPSYVVAPAHELGFVDPDSQDLALCVLALQNIANPHEVFPAIAKALKVGGRLGIVLNHPAFRIPKQSSWGWDPETRAQYRRVDKYLSESKDRIQMHPGSDPSATTLSYHRPLQYFVKQLGKAGFAITNLEEWVSHRVSDSGPRAEAENAIRKEIPLFLFIEAKRLS
jgi:ubiquinone/menaquinone biosynthesis C-methylase UbiE